MLPIVAYLDEISVAPGEGLQVMVSSYGAKTYRADLRRIIQGDTNPLGPGYRDEPVPLELGGVRSARRQEIRPGSYIDIDLRGALAGIESFTIAAIVWPTRLGTSDQGLVHLSSVDGGVELMLDRSGTPCVRLCRGGQTEALSLEVPLPERRWTLVAASHDAAAARLCLAAISLERQPGDHRSEAVERSLPEPWRCDKPAQITIAALSSSGRETLCHFDGKIDAPALFEAAIDPGDLLELVADPERLARHPSLLGFWDFSHGIDSDRIVDQSPHHFDGVALNCPARAVTGWRWRGETLCWRDRSDLYSAIHFHADDLYDAGWEPDFAFRIPEDLRSGVYAVRLVPDGREDDAYYAVFAVRPPRRRPTDKSVAFLMPTASYLAYANHRLGLDVPGTEVGMGRLVEIDRHHAFLQEHPEFGFSFYEVHADGSGVFYSSRKRPILDMQPKVQGFLGGLGSNLWQFNADTHILGWLEHTGVDYDVITDEDLHREGLALLRRYRVVLTGTHPEYYSEAMLDGLQGFVDRGGRLLYLGGNGFYWRISYSGSMPGVIECRRSEAGIRPWEPGHGQYHHAFTGEMGGLWRRNGRAPNRLVGVGMASQGFDISEPYRMTRASENPRVQFMFEGIKGPEIGAFGLSGGGAAGLEVDRADMSLGTPGHALVVATSMRHTDVYLLTPEEMLDPTPDMSGTQNEQIRADLTFFETAGGGAVFSVGSIAWAGAMAWNGYDNEISRLTRNVLRRFADPKPFKRSESEVGL